VDTPASDAEHLPLSFGQEQLWFLDRLDPGQGTYNIPGFHRLRGPLDVAALGRALTLVVARHEALRATFPAPSGTPVQVIAPPGEVPVPVEDLDAGALPAALDEEAARPFDLSRQPPLRARILRLAADDHVLCLTFHHIAADGWSMGVLVDELSRAYAALSAGGGPDLDEPAVRYGDFVLWQRDWLQGEVVEAQLRHWERTLRGAPVVELPADRPRPPRPTFAGDVVTRDLGVAPGALAAVGRRADASPLMVLVAAVDAVLARYTGADDLSLGTSMLGRRRPELERVVGFFVNLVVLRVDVSGDPRFEDLLARVRDTTLAALDHQDVPFEQVVGRLEGARDPSRNPLFQVAVQLLRDEDPLALPGIAGEVISRPSGRSRFDLSLTFREAPDGLRVSVEYARDLYDRWRVEQLVDHLARVLAAVAGEPGLRVSQLPLLDEDDRRRLLAAGHGPQVPFRRDPLHVRIAEQARRDPAAVAGVYEGKELSYGDLARQARAVAAHLRRAGVGHEDVVAVALDRGLEVLVALVGVLAAGAAFAVVDPTHPHRRQRFILADTGARVVLTRSDLVASLPGPDGWTPVCLDTDWPRIEASAEAVAGVPWEERATGASLAYVLYTSGTTGEPKGALIEHRDLGLLVASFAGLYDLGPGDRLLQYAALVFDLSEAEIFSALSVGATVVMASPDTLLSPPAVEALIRDQAVTYVGAPPAVLALLAPGPYPAVRAVLAGGEALPAELVNRWNGPGRTFVNAYGPTETAVACTAHVCEGTGWTAPPPIGRPLPHRRLYVVDGTGDLAPVGVPGELLIGGDDGVGRGYLNRPDLTDRAFVPDPFRPGGRVYRSGDLVRWTPAGVLEFVGRKDNQVKLRGLRVELDEIAAVLETHPHVERAVVALREDQPGHRQLVGYVVPAGPGADPAELRAHVAAELPAYMAPSAWVTLDAVPLRPSGKVDRDRLPPPAAVEATGTRTPLSTETERTVGAVLCEVLGLPEVGADDNFFILGGTSLQAILVLTRLADLLGVTLAVRTVYGAGTVGELAAHVDELLAGATAPGTGADGPDGEWDLLAQVEDMSDEDVARLLAELDGGGGDAP
jgi:amino acid adenylation domain-containing protein